MLQDKRPQEQIRVPASDEGRSGDVVVVSRKPHGLALAVAMTTLAILTWGLARPALWLDEAASVVATQRSWSDLPILLSGSDAPLVPYYAFLKAVTSAVTTIAPAAASSPEALFRGPSVAAMVLAAWALSLWLARRGPARTAVILLTAVPFSRYGQEVRPYAFVLAAAVACTILWTRLVRDPRRRWVVLYAFTVVALVSANLLAATLVGAHIVAALVCPPKSERRSAAVRTAVAAAIGLLLVSPFAILASLNGRGPSPGSTLQLRALARWLVRLSEGSPLVVAVLMIGAVATLALVLVTVRRPPPGYQFIARLAAAWALVPPALLIPAVLLKPRLARDRYVFFVLPAWAILGALCVITLIHLVAGLVTRITSRPDVPPSNSGLSAYLAGGVAAVVLLAVCASQVDGLMRIRSSAGHGEDIRPALATASRPGYADLPLVVLPPSGALRVAAYSSAHEHRLLDVEVQRNQARIWPAVASRRERETLLDQHSRVGLLLRAPSSACGSALRGNLVARVERCLPTYMRAMGYRVVSAETSGNRWAFAVVAREQSAR